MYFETKSQVFATPDDFAFARKLSAPIWVFDTDRGQIAMANAAACALWNASSEKELRGRDLSVGMSNKVQERLMQYQDDFLASSEKFFETWTLHPKGEPTTVNIVLSGLSMPDGRMAMLCEVVGSVTETPETLRSAEALLHTDVPIALFDSACRPLYQNPAARALFHKADTRFDEVLVNPPDLLEIHEDCEAVGESRRVRLIQTTRGRRWFDLSVKKCLDSVTGEHAWLVTGVNVTELKTTRDKAHFLAERDLLTGCFNRSFIQKHFETRKQQSALSDCALIVLDLDDFKTVNDTFGHGAGDAVLAQMAQRLMHAMDEGEVVARIGGDEFICLLDCGHDEGALQARLDDIRGSLQQPYVYDALKLEISSSIGGALVAGDDWTIAQRPKANRPEFEWDASFKKADLALYHSKALGRGRATIYTDQIGAEAAARNWLEQELKQAISNGELLAHFQPRIDLELNRVVSLEALLRWNHPLRGLISPDEFIPVCEEIGMIEEVGLMVLESAVDHLISWRSLGLDVNVSVNVSARQLLNDRFVHACEKLRDRPGFSAEHLELEITETSLVDHFDGAAARVAEISALGFKIAIDDFGMGHSNLSQISSFPVDCIKIDRSFIEQLPDRSALVGLIFALATEMGAKVVAEGVERSDQIAWLRKRGCNEVQGFYFSEAVAPGEVLELCNAIADQLSPLCTRVGAWTHAL